MSIQRCIAGFSFLVWWVGNSVFPLSLFACPHDTTGLKGHFAYLEWVTGVYGGLLSLTLEALQVGVEWVPFEWTEGSRSIWD